MVMVKLTFYEYLRLEPQTTYSKIFKEHFDVNILPDKVCSSKFIYNLLFPIVCDTAKQEIFKQTFSEYFKYKISLHDNINTPLQENTPLQANYDSDKFIR